VHGLRDPTVHSAQVTVDSIPGDFADETADLAEALDAVELRRADGVLVAGALLEERAVRLALEELPGEVAEVRVGLHAFHEPLEVARRQLEISVELADVIEVVELDMREPCVERLDHAR